MSSKADQLGESSSFGAVGRRRSQRGKLIDDVTDTGERETSHQDLAPPRILPLMELAHNPFNPRHDLRDLQETAESMLEKGQIQPITVVTRAAFLHAHPGQEETLGTASYVVLDGNRRLGAARLAGLEELRVDVNDEFAGSAEELLEAALVANVHREDLTPLEEAEALATLVEVLGSQRQVARRLGKTHGWVSQRLTLLGLAPELQQQLNEGSLTVEDGRRIGKLPHQRQAGEVERVQADRAQRRPVKRPKGAKESDLSKAGGGYGVNASPDSDLDWGDPEAVADMLRHRMDPDRLKALAGLLIV